MKILLSGSSGFIGYHLTQRLLSENFYVVGIDDHNNYYSPRLKKERLSQISSKNFKFYEANINDDLSFLKERFDFAINLAAQAGVRVNKSREYLYEKTNILGFESFCNFCQRNNVKNIIYASSSSVYSDFSGKKFSENDTKLNPLSLYGRSKLSNEEYALKFSKKYGLSMIGLRFFSVYGPFGRPDMAYYLFAKSLLHNKDINLIDRGQMSRDMTFIDDIVDGIIGAIKFINLKSKSSMHEIFNLGNDSPIRTMLLLETLMKKMKKKSNIIFKDSLNESFYTHADISKANKLLEYSPKISFEEGIDKFIAWYMKYEKK